MIAGILRPGLAAADRQILKVHGIKGHPDHDYGGGREARAAGLFTSSPRDVNAEPLALSLHFTAPNAGLQLPVD